MLSSKKFSY